MQLVPSFNWKLIYSSYQFLSACADVKTSLTAAEEIKSSPFLFLLPLFSCFLLFPTLSLSWSHCLGWDGGCYRIRRARGERCYLDSVI